MTFQKTSAGIVLGGAMFIGATSISWAGAVNQTQTTLGYVLTDGHGMTLYTFAKDEGEKIACVEACSQIWPPLLADAKDKAMGEYSVVTRPDGAKQWAYKGKPLYRWSKDAKPGDATGEGFKDLWHVARP